MTKVLTWLPARWFDHVEGNVRLPLCGCPRPDILKVFSEDLSLPATLEHDQIARLRTSSRVLADSDYEQDRVAIVQAEKELSYRTALLGRSRPACQKLNLATGSCTGGAMRMDRVRSYVQILRWYC